MSEYFRVPETREEVVSHFKTYPDKFFSEVMTELFLLYHDDMGKSVSQAYEDTLRAAVEDTLPNNRVYTDAVDSAASTGSSEASELSTSQTDTTPQQRG